MKGTRRGNVWFQLGKEIAFWEENPKILKVGRIVGHCSDWIAIEEWIPLSAPSKSTRHNNGMARWRKPISPQRLTIRVTHAFPIATSPVQSAPGEIYSIDDSTDWIEAWWKNITIEHPEEEDVQMKAVQHRYTDDDLAERPWQLDKGKGLEDMLVDNETSDSDTITAMSDGGVLHAGTHKAKGGYGYVIREARHHEGWGNFTFTMSGRGSVEGSNLYMDSTRAEARGLLATMRRIWYTTYKFPFLKCIDHATDNEAVVDIFAGLRERSAADWLRATDSDIWHEIKCLEEEFQAKAIKYSVRWVRSHPEKRHTWLKDWTEDDVLNHMADRLATVALQEYVGSGNTQLQVGNGKNHMWFVYTQEKGGPKLRITGNLRTVDAPIAY